MKIRYTQGPDEIELGKIVFKLGEAKEVTDELAAQALLPQRVYEYGFETVQATAPEPINVAPQPPAPPLVVKPEITETTKE